MTRETLEGSGRPGPLDGIKVVEYGVFHAGPGAGAILGDLGAQVIKIEMKEGDPERYWKKVGQIDFSLPPNGDSLMFEFSNRHKRGICVDIRKEKGREIFLRLLKDADVFLTNLRKTTKVKLGIDYATLSQVNPKLIHANVSGYGPEGPMSNVGAFDPMGQARSGMMFATGSKEPTLLHLGVVDQATAIAASHAILAALVTRERKGIGQEVHVSIYSTALWLLYANVMSASYLHIDAGQPGVRTQASPLRNAFRCKDGNWIIGVHHPEERYWPRLCQATGKEDLLEDARFSDPSGRRERCEELVALFDQVFATRTRDEWMERLPRHGLMFCPVQRVHEVLDDPQALINHYVVPFSHPALGEVKLPGYPAHFSACGADTRGLAPVIGQHTEEILRQMGYTDSQILELRQAGVVS